MDRLAALIAAARHRLGTRMGRFRRAVAGWDWPMIVIVVGFAVAMPWQLALTALFPWMTWRPAGPFSAYEQALRDAAIKHPEDQRILRRVDGKTVQFINFRATPLPEGQINLTGPLWVALPDEVRAACGDTDDAVLRLEHVLGLPPRGGNYQIYPITAQGGDATRPCMSGDLPTASACTFDLPTDPTKTPPASDPAAKAAAYDDLSKAYRQLRFVTEHMWDVYRTDFRDPRAAQGDYPDTGYPFTGMGWTYNWDPAAKSHAGVSEFVLPANTSVTVGAAVDPTGFCNGSASLPPVTVSASAGTPPASAPATPPATAPVPVAAPGAASPVLPEPAPATVTANPPPSAPQVAPASTSPASDTAAAPAPAPVPQATQQPPAASPAAPAASPAAPAASPAAPAASPAAPPTPPASGKDAPKKPPPHPGLPASRTR